MTMPKIFYWLLKGNYVTRWIFFLKRPIKLNQYFLYMRKLVFKFLACWVLRKIKMKFLLASLKTLTNSKSCSKNRINFCSGFALIGQFILVYIHSRLWTIFEGTDGYRKAGTSSRKRITGRNFTIRKWFNRSKQKLHFGFPSQKDK